LSGRLCIKWEIEANTLMLTWNESGGPPVQKPTSRGFGTRSVIASIESQLGGQAEFDWRPEGLICRLSVPLSGHFSESQMQQKATVDDNAKGQVRDRPASSQAAEGHASTGARRM
jgi:hypothetical protein